MVGEDHAVGILPLGIDPCVNFRIDDGDAPVADHRMRIGSRAGNLRDGPIGDQQLAACLDPNADKGTSPIDVDVQVHP